MDNGKPRLDAEIAVVTGSDSGIYFDDQDGAERTRARIPKLGRKALALQHWDNGLRTNLYGPFYCCQQFIRAIEGSGRHGTIINITSVHQAIPRAGAAAYDVAKGGLRNLTTTLGTTISVDGALMLFQGQGA